MADNGYTAGGNTTPDTEKYDDVANTWTVKANLNTARRYPAGFSLNSYGYTAGGYNGFYSITEKYAAAANTWTVKANLNTARYGLAGFSLNGSTKVVWSVLPDLDKIFQLVNFNNLIKIIKI